MGFPVIRQTVIIAQMLSRGEGLYSTVGTTNALSYFVYRSYITL